MGSKVNKTELDKTLKKMQSTMDISYSDAKIFGDKNATMNSTLSGSQSFITKNPQNSGNNCYQNKSITQKKSNCHVLNSSRSNPKTLPHDSQSNSHYSSKKLNG